MRLPVCLCVILFQDKQDSQNIVEETEIQRLQKRVGSQSQEIDALRREICLLSSAPEFT